MAPHTTLGNNACIIFRGSVDVVTTADGIEINTEDTQALGILSENLDRPQTFTIYKDSLGSVSLNGIESENVEVSGGLKPEQRG